VRRHGKNTTQDSSPRKTRKKNAPKKAHKKNTLKNANKKGAPITGAPLLNLF
jgi:hypothetical protein